MDSGGGRQAGADCGRPSGHGGVSQDLRGYQGWCLRRSGHGYTLRNGVPTEGESAGPETTQVPTTSGWAASQKPFLGGEKTAQGGKSSHRIFHTRDERSEAHQSGLLDRKSRPQGETRHVENELVQRDDWSRAGGKGVVRPMPIWSGNNEAHKDSDGLPSPWTNQGEEVQPSSEGMDQTKRRDLRFTT